MAKGVRTAIAFEMEFAASMALEVWISYADAGEPMVSGRVLRGIVVPNEW